MSPVEHLPAEEAEPTGALGDLATTVRSFVDAVDAGRVTQIATFHRWVAELRRAVNETPVQSGAPPRSRWS